MYGPGRRIKYRGGAREERDFTGMDRIVRMDAKEKGKEDAHAYSEARTF
jgi:hypothetical protein